MEYNTIIIGCGISGMSAALYLKRANIDFCIFEKEAPGGQLLRTSAVENYPGVLKTDGATLATNLYQQMNALQVPIYFEEILSLEKQGEKFCVVTTGKSYYCKNIIYATGRQQKKLEIENEDNFIGKGISYCATCDGALYKGKDVAVIGAGNSAFEESLYLSNLCDSVTIFVRRDQFRADASLIDQVKKKKNIKILTNKVVKELHGKDHLESITVEDKEDAKERTYPVAGAFVYIGQIPKTSLLDSFPIEKENGYIITNEKMETNIPHLYACGDCRKKELYQLVTASYDGVIAANEIIQKRDTND